MSLIKPLSEKTARFLNTHPEARVIVGDDSVSDTTLHVYDNRGADTSKSSVVINIDESLITAALIVEKEDEDRVKKWTISNCRNIDDAFNYLMSPNIKEQLSDTESVLLIKFKINEHFGDLSSGEIHELSKKCDNKSIVVFFTSSDEDKFLIYWKSKEIQKILTLVPYKDGFTKEDKSMCEYVVEFLIHSLKNGYLGLHQNFSLAHEGTKIQLHLLADSRNYNLLLRASEDGNTAVVENLLKKGINAEISTSKVNAQLLAYEKGHFDVVKILVEANLLYPQDMDIQKCTEEFKHFYDTFRLLHDMILARNAHKVEEIVINNPGFRYFYNFMNESALKTALVNNCFDIYELLLSLQIYFGPHEDADSIMECFSEEERRHLREINFKYFKGSPEKHINILMANSILAHDTTDENAKLKHLQRAFRTLNENPSIRVILMAVAASKKFRIIFDFNRDSVQLIDPTADSYTNGIFYLSGRIYIGAKQLLDPSTENETFATLAHELCHYAMNLAFNNAAKPYKTKDKKAAKEFDKISQICYENREREEIIDLVFEHYPDFMQHAELIVRPPHLMALHLKSPEKLQESRENFSELFQVFENKVVAAMRRALSDIEAGADKIIEEKDKIISRYKYKLFFSILLTIIVGLVGYLSYKPTYVYNRLSVNNQNRVKDAYVSYKGIEVRFNDLFGNVSVVYDKLSSDHISDMLKEKILDFNQTEFLGYEFYLNHDWGNLTSKLKDKILTSNFTFQNESLKFQEMSALHSDTFNSLTSPQIIQILDGTPLNISNMIENRTKFYIERKFIPENTIEIFLEYRHHFFHFDENKNSGDLPPPPPPPGGIPIHHPEFLMPKTNLTFEEFYKNYKKKSFDKPPEFFAEAVDGFNIFNSLTPWFKGTLTTLADANEFLHKNFDQVIQEVEEKKILVLSAEAGAGKTVTFQQLAMTIKKKFPTRWVAYISLKDYIEHYNHNERLKNVEKFLEEIFKLGSKNEFEREIFKDSFKKGMVVVLWDGFDEIAPTYDEFVLNVINYIRHYTENCQYVCTRPIFSKKLGDNFNLVPYKLVSFTDKEKREFLTKFFISTKTSPENIEKNIESVNKIVEFLEHKPPNDLNPRTFNTPLMLTIIAEVQDGQDLTATPNYYLIYQQFIQKKLKIWESKGNFSSKFVNSVFLGTSKVDPRKIIQKYAILSDVPMWAYIYFPIFNQAQIIRYEIPKTLTFEDITRIGIFYINGKYKFEFAHKTFTEFFIAQYLIENVYNAEEFISEFEAEARLELFFLTFKTYGRFQEIITNFMKSFLETEDENRQEKFSTPISNVLRTKYKKLLINFLTEAHPGIFEFFAEFFKKDHELLVDLLGINDDKTFYTELFNPLSEVYFIDPTEVARIFKNYLTSDEFERLINGRNQKGVIITGMFYYGASKSPKIHETISINKNYSFWDSSGSEINHNLKISTETSLEDSRVSRGQLNGSETEPNLKNSNISSENNSKVEPNLKISNESSDYDSKIEHNLKKSTFGSQNGSNVESNLKIHNISTLSNSETKLNLKISKENSTSVSESENNLKNSTPASSNGFNIETNLKIPSVISSSNLKIEHNLKNLNKNSLHDQNSKSNLKIDFWRFYDSELKPNLKSEELRELFLSPAASVMYVDYSSQNSTRFWSEISNKLSKSEVGILLGNIFNYLFEIVAEFPNFDETSILNNIIADTESQLSDKEIFEMILTSNIFHKAVFSANSLKILWIFLTNHTNIVQRREILMKSDKGSFYFTFRDSFHRDRYLHGDYFHDYFHYYDRSQYKVFQRALLVNDLTLRGLNTEPFDFALKIYNEHFEKSELKEIILKSNLFLLRLIDHSPPEVTAKLANFLSDLFKGDEKLLRDFIVRKIGHTNLTILDIFKGFDALGDGSSEISRNRKVFNELYNTLKYQTGLN